VVRAPQDFAPQVVDAVVDTDRVEQHRTRALREPGGEDAAIVGEHLAGKAMGAKRELAGCTDRPGGRPHISRAETQ